MNTLACLSMTRGVFQSLFRAWADGVRNGAAADPG